MYFRRNDQDFINTTGHGYKSFDKLLDKFKLYYLFYTFDDNMGIIRKWKLQENGTLFGIKRDITAWWCLYLIVTWYRARGSCSITLNMMFILTSTPMYKWIHFDRKVLIHLRCRDPDAVIRLPTSDEVRFYQNAIGTKYPNVTEV